MRINKSIFIKTSFNAVHCWPKAPDTRSAWHLKHPHRHKFYVVATLEVKKNDRELEFFTVLDNLDHMLECMLPGDNDSCEDFAEYIATYLLSEYGPRKIRVSVSEDQQNGAIYDAS